MKVGVLALQGAFREHREVLDALGVEAIEVRTPEVIDALDALILPGGESTTMSKLLDSSGLRAPIADRLDDGMPVLGTCAGLILLAAVVVDGRPDQESFGIVDVTVRRNAYGRQRDSFETDLDVHGLGGHTVAGGPFHGVFIRAPGIERCGPNVEVLASHEGRPVFVREGVAFVSTFHPELSGDFRLHQLFLDEVTS
ncbi:MAG: pyridoxal 5'-phosphate synthase glutaminase subunit PdxT [Acidimicrobiia bacterium]